MEIDALDESNDPAPIIAHCKYTILQIRHKSFRLKTNVHTHECMYLCMYTRMHVCMHVILYVEICTCRHNIMYSCIYICMRACRHACVYKCSYVQGVYVCVYLFKHVRNILN